MVSTVATPRAEASADMWLSACESRNGREPVASRQKRIRRLSPTRGIEWLRGNSVLYSTRSFLSTTTLPRLSFFTTQQQTVKICEAPFMAGTFSLLGLWGGARLLMTNHRDTEMC